jgi:hypothetical protein
VVVYLLLSRVRSCVAWWNSLNPLERELLTFLLLFYYGGISVIIVIFTLHLVLPFLISSGGVLEGLVEGLAVGFVFAVFWFRRALLQCDKLEDFIIGKPLYYRSLKLLVPILNTIWYPVRHPLLFLHLPYHLPSFYIKVRV